MLRDDLFLLAHDDDGRLIIPEPAVGAGLAGATLVDLFLSGRVAVVDGRLDVLATGSAADPDLDATLAAIGTNPDPTGPRAWVSWLSAGIYERTADALVASGRVQRSTTWRLGLLQINRCLPTSVEDLVRLRSRLRYGVHDPHAPNAPTAALAGLVRALRLHRALLLSMPEDALLAELDRMASGSHPIVRQVVRAVDAVITAATYR